MALFPRRARASQSSFTATASITDPLADGQGVLVHCGWVYDNGDDIGGFTAGELLLRDDGAFFTRTGSSTYDQGQTRYWFNLWVLDDRWTGRKDVESCVAWMRSRGYGLYEPGPVPVNETEAGPFAGMPPPGRPLE
jgi:hypothetical protein